jgi:hypothetical protein
MNTVPLVKQELTQVGAVLASDACKRRVARLRKRAAEACEQRAEVLAADVPVISATRGTSAVAMVEGGDMRYGRGER